MSKKIETSDIIVCRNVDKTVEILLTLRSPNSFSGNMWCIPGGHLNENEDPLEGGMRELYEETGVDLRSIKSKVKKIFVHELNEHRTKYGVTYSCVLPENFKYNIRPQASEISEIRWFNIQKIPYDNIAFDHGDILSRFKNKITK